MLADRESLERAADEAFREIEGAQRLPVAEVFKLGFYAGFRAAKFEERDALIKTLPAEDSRP